MRSVFALALLTFTYPAFAAQHDWPALFDVSDVAVDDVLNIRSRPDASSEIVGSLASNATGIEILWPDDQGKWGQVNAGESTGWVSLVFVTRQANQSDSNVPAVARCFGTEPFWSLDRKDGNLISSGLDRPTITYAISDTITASGRIAPYAIRGESTDATIWLRFNRAECSDGMSDRLFAIDADVIIDGLAGSELLSGCCTLSVN